MVEGEGNGSYLKPAHADDASQLLLESAGASGAGSGSGRDLMVQRHHNSKVHQQNIELQHLLPSTVADVNGRRAPVDKAGGVAQEEGPTLVQQALAALFYAVASLVVIFVNKEVLTTKAFPSFFFIAISQFTSTCVVVSILRMTGHIRLAAFNSTVLRGVAPLMLMFVLNTLCGLGGTKHVSLPMFTVLRRFSILMTMLLERFVLKTKTSFIIKFSVMLMIGGALIAAFYDLEFQLKGYLLILGNDFFTAAYGISIKRALNLQIPQMSLLYFNSLFGATIMTMVVLCIPGESEAIVSFHGWRDPIFLVLYLCTSFMGSVLQYSIFMCTKVNSALTTSVVGCMKNLLTTVVGMYGMGGDYSYDLMNSIGLAVSMGGSFLYSWAKVTSKR